MQPSSFPFWDSNHEDTPNDDFTFFFSSPTTEFNELARQENLHQIAIPQPPTSEIPHVLKPEPAEFEPFLTPSPLVNTMQPKPNHSFEQQQQQQHHHQHHHQQQQHQQQQQPIPLQSENVPFHQSQAQGSNSFPPYSEANSTEASHYTKTVGKKRSLQAMQAVAKNQAPCSALTDSELMSIAEMQETDQDLMDSKEVYSSMAEFKKCLVKHGYRLSAVHVEIIQSNQPENFEASPIELVINKPQSTPSAEASPQITENKQETDNDNSKPNSASNTSEISGPQQAAQQSLRDGRPTKRSRLSGKGDSSDSGERRFSCVVCQKSMSDFDTLVRHFRHTHQQLKPFSCPRCGGFYSSEGTLWHHIRNVHTETPRKYKCNHCDASYDSFGAKTRHEHATHNTNVPQFLCSFQDCKRAFNFPAHLESHAQQCHPGFRPFQCTECSKSFPSSNGLTRHCREVHQRPQAYSCSCSKSYSKRCHLKRHLLRVHRMSEERVQEEMKKQPHPGLLHILPPAPPALTE